jgi:competence protein ComEA
MEFSRVKDDFLEFTLDQKRAIGLLSIIAISIALFLFITSRGEAVELPQVKVVEEKSKRTIFIHVAGDVRKPGVYPILEGSRVIDAVTAAGGAKAGIDLSNINLARILVDGEQVLVGKERNPSSKKGKSGFTGTVFVNRATASQFDSLDGIGPVIAKRIIAYRNSNGPFVDIADLQKVDGIGGKTFERIKGRLSL